MENFQSWLRVNRCKGNVLTHDEKHSAQALYRYINEHAVCAPMAGVVFIVFSAAVPVLGLGAGLSVLYFAMLGVKTQFMQ